MRGPERYFAYGAAVAGCFDDTAGTVGGCFALFACGYCWFVTQAAGRRVAVGLVGFFSFAGGALVLVDFVGRGFVGLESMGLRIVGLRIVRMGCVRFRFVSLGLRRLELGGLAFPGCFGCFAKSFVVNPILLLARYTMLKVMIVELLRID